MSGVVFARQVICSPAKGCKFPLPSLLLIVCRQAGLTFQQRSPCLCAMFTCVPAALRVPCARLKPEGRRVGKLMREKQTKEFEQEMKSRSEAICYTVPAANK